MIDCRKRNFFTIRVFLSFKVCFRRINDFAVCCTGCVRRIGGYNGINGFNMVRIVFANELHTCRFLVFCPQPFVQSIFVIDCRKRNFFTIRVFLSFKVCFRRINDFAVRCTSRVRRIGGNYGFNGFFVVCIVLTNKLHTCRFFVICPNPRIQRIIVTFGGNRLCLKRCWRSSITISIIRFGCLTIPIFFITCRFTRFIFRRELLQLTWWFFL